jgi:hypothetical protein
MNLILTLYKLVEGAEEVQGAEVAVEAEALLRRPARAIGVTNLVI